MSDSRELAREIRLKGMTVRVVKTQEEQSKDIFGATKDLIYPQGAMTQTTPRPLDHGRTRLLQSRAAMLAMLNSIWNSTH